LSQESKYYLRVFLMRRDTIASAASIQCKSMMPIAYSPISKTIINSHIIAKFINFLPIFRSIYVSWLNLRFFASPILTMMHLHISALHAKDISAALHLEWKDDDV